MFKLESYITPLIVSYVDKYIKNLKPEDSQVSLWGGDAVFNNLDLRLDVLEEELRMPFSFVNGHIHELRIHVPWTKLGSEPVVITINTIECILKLCEGCDNGSSTEGSSVRSGGGGATPRVRGAKRSDAGSTPSPEQQQAVVPPSYVQSLINRVVNNISVVCNNVVLKYVEDDIVLSLNVKSVEVFGADERWEKAFVDLSLPELVLRKIIRLQDLTVCLDRRNASGRIDAYQEPLLYRCSLDCRLHLQFESLHARHLLTSRLDLLCDRLDFSVTDRQLPMFLRLIELCLALHADEIGTPPVRSGSAETEDGTSGGGSPVASGSALAIDGLRRSAPDDGEQQGWGAWMWSYVPAVWEEEQDGALDGVHMPPPVLRFGIYIRQASFVFKVVEPDSNSSFSTHKISYRPMCCLHNEGVFVDLILRGIDVLNCRFGIVKVLGVAAGHCPCGVADCLTEGTEESAAAEQQQQPFLYGGLATHEWTTDYLHDSLFDSTSPENNGGRRQVYTFDWEEHLTRVSLAEMQARSPAFAMDYFYLLEIPEDVSEKSSGRSVNDADHFKERTGVRITVGPAQLDLNSSVMHRLQFIRHCAEQYDYEPYARPREVATLEGLGLPTREEVAAMEACLPTRTTSVHVMQPIVRLFVQDHPSYDASSPVSTAAETRRSGRREEHHHREQPKLSAALPALLVYGDRVDIHRTHAMVFPERIVRIATVVRHPTDNLLHHCHTHFSLKISNCSAALRCEREGQEARSVVIQPFSVTMYQKELLLPHFWNNQLQPHSEVVLEVEHFACRLIAAQVMLLDRFRASWFDPNWLVRQLDDTSLVGDSFFVGTRSQVLELTLSNVHWKQCHTAAVRAYAGSVASVGVQLVVRKEKSEVIVPILRGPEPADPSRQQMDTGAQSSRKYSGGALADWISFTIQVSRDVSVVVGAAPSLFLAHVGGVACCVDPRLLRWFAYQPRVLQVRVDTPSSHSFQRKESASVEHHSKVSGMSSTTTLLTESHVGGSECGAATTTDGRALKYFTHVVADWYPLLCGLGLQLELEGIDVFLSVDPVPWSARSGGSGEGIASDVRRMRAAGTLPPLLVFNLPRLVASNDVQRHPTSHSGEPPPTTVLSIPVARSEGFGGHGADHFPWALTVDHYSCYVMGAGPPEHCVSPGFLSATVAVNSKSGGASVAPSTTSSSSSQQYSVCIHCDFQPIHLSVARSQAELVSRVAKNILSALPHIVRLIGGGTAPLSAAQHQSGYPDATSVLSPSGLAVSLAERKVKSRSQASITGAAPLTSPAVDPSSSNPPPDGTKLESSAKPSVGSSDGPKVSVWLQITLPKVKLSVIGEHHPVDVRLDVELEDISSSIDVQEVYSKIKLKVTSMSSSNYSRTSTDVDWLPGPHEGITFCCLDRLTKAVHTPNPKTGVRSSCFDVHEPQAQSTQSAQDSFIVLTFTRAQCRNIQKRWSKILRDCSGTDLGLKLHNMCETSAQGGARVRYISELDLKVTSFDVVFHAPLVHSTARVFRPLTEVLALITAAATATPATVFEASDTKRDPSPIAESRAASPDEDSDSTLPTFSNANLPLLYVNCGAIRIFLPSTDTDGTESAAEPDGGTAAAVKAGIRREDMAVVQVKGISLTHNVENPLSRVVLRQDVYNVAQRAGILSIPGSEVEDRQYQLDVVGLSLGTGSWAELVRCGRRRAHELATRRLKSMGENPALEWNSKTPTSETDEPVRDVILCPLVVWFDLHVTAAPAIVFQKSGISDRSPADGVLVSGHSLEVNATTDIEFYIGLHQMALLDRLVTTNLEHLFGEQLESTASTSSVDDSFSAVSGGEPRDSGIDSQSSTTSFLLAGLAMSPPGDVVPGRLGGPHTPGSSPLPNRSSDAGDVHRWSDWSRVTPFEVLLTAGNIVVAVYSPEHLLGCWGKEASGRGQVAASAKNKSHKTAAKKRCEPQWREQHSSSTEDSPVRRRVKVKPKAGRIVEERETTGYEGSEESLDEVSSDLEPGQADGSRTVPLLHLSISQPYSFLKCHRRSQKLELSCFDVNVRGTASKRVIAFNHLLPRPEDYDAPWLETLPGDAHPKTGIPPALYTLSVTNFMEKPEVGLRIERPLRINFGVRQYEKVLGYWRAASSLRVSGGGGAADVSGEMSPPSTAETASAEEVARRCRLLLSRVDRVSCRLHQLVFVLEAGVPSVHLHLGFGEASMDADFNRAEGIFSDTDNAFLCLQVEGCVVKAEVGGRMRPLIGPLSLSTDTTIVWESWSADGSLPRVLTKLDVELLLVHFDQENLRCLQLIADHFLPASDHPTTTGSFPFTYFRSPREIEEEEDEVHLQTWQDDLRIGVFQYTQDADDTKTPRPNEIVFSKGYSDAGRPASMTWRYPEPRALVWAEIHPVPFRAAPGGAADCPPDVAGVGAPPAETTEVLCALQYWDALPSRFLTYRVFRLSETQHCLLEMPPASVDACRGDGAAVSTMWRVLMDYETDPTIEEEALVERGGPRRSLVSPLALAACMRVDSCFAPAFVPFFEGLLNLGLVKITLGNHFPPESTDSDLPVPSSINGLSPYRLDGTMPEHQEFVVVSLENVAARNRHWHRADACKLEIGSTVRLDVLDYRFLVFQPLLESFSLKSQLSVQRLTGSTARTGRGGGDGAVYEASASVGALHLHLTPSALHTLSLAARAWKDASCDGVVMNGYVVCNDTDEKLRFGQVDTDESVGLAAYQAHAYSWRTHKRRRVLHVCMESMQWKWCEPFSVDSPGTQIRTMGGATANRQHGQLATLIIRVRAVPGTEQRVVVIGGQLRVANRLTRNLEVRLGPSPGGADCAAVRLLAGGATLPSFVVAEEEVRTLQVRLAADEDDDLLEESPWSPDVAYNKATSSRGSLVRVPGRSGECVGAWCHVFRRPVGPSAVQTLVLFVPLYVVRTHLPLPLSLEVTTPALNRSSVVYVDGRGAEHQLHCPGDPTLTHQLSFGPSDDADGPAASGNNNNNPPLPLSPSMIGQAEGRSHLAPEVDLDDLCREQPSTSPLLWPYGCEELEREVDALPNDARDLLLRHRDGDRDRGEPDDTGTNYYQPKIDLEVCLVQRWPGCDTLLVEVKPWALLDNRTEIEVVVARSQEGAEEELSVPAGVVFALPRLHGTFKIGVRHQDRVHYSSSIELASDEWSLNRYWPRVSGVLQQDDGHVLCEIFVASTSCRPRTCLLVLSSRRQRGIRIFTLRPYYTVLNVGRRPLTLSAFSVAANEPATASPPSPDHDAGVTALPVGVPASLLYVCATPADACNRMDGRQDVGSVHYVRLSGGVASRVSEQSETSLRRWSRCVRLRRAQGQVLTETDFVHSVEVPRDSGDERRVSAVGWPIRLTAHLWKGLMYLVVRDDAAPQLVLHNNCPFELHYGQEASPATEEKEFTVYEELDLVDEVPVLPARSSCFYTFPFVDDKFPELYESQLLPKLHLARRVNEDDDEVGPCSPVWSGGVDVFAGVDQFLNVPNCGDIKVHMERVVPSVHVFLDPVNRVEVSAKEIRSRIKGKSGPGTSPEHQRQTSGWRPTAATVKPKLKMTKTSPRRTSITGRTTTREASSDHRLPLPVQRDTESTAHPPTVDQQSDVSSPPRGSLPRISRSTSPEVLFYGNVHLKQVCVVFTEGDAELVRISLDDAYFATRPLLESTSAVVSEEEGGETSSRGGRRRRTWIATQRQEVVVCVGDVQVDNQRHSAGGYDFPVVLIRQESSDEDNPGDRPPTDSSSTVSVSPWDLSRARRESRAVVVVLLQRSFLRSEEEDDRAGEADVECGWWAGQVEVTLKPVAIYLEDTLLYAVSRYVQHHASVGRWSSSDPLVLVRRDRRIPDHVRVLAATLGRPLRVQVLTVHPVSLLLSVHASLKLFLSLDQTPLTFGQFRRQDVSTTWYRLGHALARHYMSGALFRVGWVLGSLDLLANPGGLARALGRGVADFVRLPYRGLLLGPWHFASGVLHGSSSLLRHSGAGTLISLTNLASSVSRNMDRLSLDRDHSERNEEMRRCPPAGVASGLSQGFTGLGISLLGAVAGIVDQPLQSIHGDPEQSLSPTAAAAGIISGVGKGLLGIVTKPIGGAAQFVAQTGQGVLHGAGWAKVLKCRYTPLVTDPSSASNSLLKYVWKMLPSSPPDARVFALEATHVNASGHYVAAVLLLTDEVLFVVSIDLDAQQQAFPLAELDCRAHGADPTLVYFVPRPTVDFQSTQPEDKNRDRIADFIDKSSKYMLQNRSKAEESESLSDTSSQPSHASQHPSSTAVVATRFFVNPRLRDTFLTLYTMAQRKLLGKGYPL